MPYGEEKQKEIVIVLRFLLLGRGLLGSGGLGKLRSELLVLDDLVAVEVGVVALAGCLAAAREELKELAALFLALGELSLAGLDLGGAAGADRGRDEALDLGGLHAGLLTGLLDLAADDELADVGIALEVKEAADLGGTLGAKAAGVLDVGHAVDLLRAGLDDDQVQDGDIGAEDAAADGLTAALAATTAPRVVANSSALQEEQDTASGEDSLGHRETILVGSTGDLQDVAIPSVGEDLALDLLAKAVVEERGLTEALIIDLELLAGVVAGERQIDLHF